VRYVYGLAKMCWEAMGTILSASTQSSSQDEFNTVYSPVRTIFAVRGSPMSSDTTKKGLAGGSWLHLKMRPFASTMRWAEDVGEGRQGGSVCGVGGIIEGKGET